MSDTENPEYETVYVSQRVKCLIEAKRAGIPNKFIAADLGSTPNSIKATLSNLREYGFDIPKTGGGPKSTMAERIAEKAFYDNLRAVLQAELDEAVARLDEIQAAQ